MARLLGCWVKRQAAARSVRALVRLATPTFLQKHRLSIDLFNSTASRRLAAAFQVFEVGAFAAAAPSVLTFKDRFVLYV
jgi:hypothetical protein